MTEWVYFHDPATGAHRATPPTTNGAALAAWDTERAAHVARCPRVIAAAAAASHAVLVLRVKLGILTDIVEGRVPATVGSFDELHDYVDANEYGGLCDPADPNSERPHLGPEVAAMQEEVDAWLRAGRR